MGMHGPPLAGQTAFGITVHVLLQPCRLSTLPSSQVSVPARMLSPHCLATHGMFCAVHFQPLSSWQLLEQPSPPFGLPSSHTSPVSMTPLPHCGGGGGGVYTHDCPTTEQV